MSHITTGQVSELIAIDARGSGIRSEVQDLIRRLASAPQTLAEMIASCNFRYVNADITEERFPLTGPVADVSDMLTVSQKDLGGKDMTTTEIEKAIDRKGYRRATLAELLVNAKTKWNGKDLVVALGSSWVDPDGGRLVPYLYEDGDGRKLGLNWDDPEHRWDAGDLFLVVRK